MNNYKITNITSQLGKRDLMYNKSLNIEYVTGFEKKTYILQPNETLFITIKSLPLSVHKLRMKKFVIVSEVDDQTIVNEYNKKNVVNNNFIVPSLDIIQKTEDNVIETKKIKKNTKHDEK